MLYFISILLSLRCIGVGSQSIIRLMVDNNENPFFFSWVGECFATLYGLEINDELPAPVL